MDPITIGLTAATVAGSAFNTASQGRMNKKSMRFSREMYEKQKSDNIAFWTQQNQYNSPEQQMKRLKEAGLNPNMIYGASSGGASGTAEQIKTPDVQTPQFRAPEISGLPSNLLMMYDLDIKQAQSDNLKADNTVKLEQAMLLQAQRDNVIADTRRKDFDYNFESELAGVSADLRRETLRKTRADIQYTLNSDERAQLSNTQSLQEGMERILSMRQNRALTDEQIRAIRSDTIIKNLDIDLRRQGINPNDPLWARVLGRLLVKFEENYNSDSNALNRENDKKELYNTPVWQGMKKIFGNQFKY